MENCSGPCLEHCYSTNKMLYLLVGIVIGVLLYSSLNIFILQQKNKNKNN
jgi:hypothetical protein